MKSTGPFEQEFRNWHPLKEFPGVTPEEYHDALAKYVDKRLAWELQNGGMFQIGLIIGILFMWAIVGLVLIYAVGANSSPERTASNGKFQRECQVRFPLSRRSVWLSFAG